MESVIDPSVIDFWVFDFSIFICVGFSVDGFPVDGLWGCLKKEAVQTKKQRPAPRKRLVFAVQLKYEKTICTKGL